MKLILRDYYLRKVNGESITLEGIIKEKKLTKKDLIQLAKENNIFFKHEWTKDQIMNRIIGSFSNIVYARECCSCRTKEENNYSFYRRIYAKYYL